MEEHTRLGMVSVEEHPVLGMAMAEQHAKLALETLGVILGANNVGLER